MQLASLPQVGASTTANGASPSGATASPPAPSSAGGTAVQSAVTIDLSPAAVAALAAQTPPSAPDAAASGAAQASASAQAPASGPGGVPAIVLRAQQLAGVIADGSTASNAEKAAALAGLYKLRFSDPTASSSDSWFAQSTQAQRDQINNAVDKSTFFKQAVSAASQFNADGMAVAKAGQSSDGAQTAYARFNQLSSDQQVLVWAGGASHFGSPEQYSAHLGLQAAGVGAGPAAPTPSASTAGSSPPPSGSSGQAYKSGQTGAQGSIVSLIA